MKKIIIGSQMKKINVQLESPWKYTSGGFGRSLMNNPPEGVRYFSKTEKKIVSNQHSLKKTRLIKQGIIKISDVIPIIKERKVSIINHSIDLIHCEHFLCKNRKIPWVVDVEGIWQFYLGKETEAKKKKIHSVLSGESCKRVIFWTDYARNGAEKIFPNLKEKFTTIYPSIPQANFKRKRRKNVTLLFVGRAFYQKGGFHALEIMNKLTREFKSINAIYVGEIPDKIRHFYAENPKIEILGMVPHDKLMKDIYPQADIFIYPGYHDSFGFAYLEAMSFGIPIVTIKRYNTKEIISEGKTGFLVPYNQDRFKIDSLGRNENKLIGDFCRKAEELVKNKKLREAMSVNCIQMIKNGKFSIKKRNKKIKSVYEEALK